METALLCRPGQPTWKLHYYGVLQTQIKVCFSLLQAGVKHVILAVSYRAEMLEAEMKEQEEKVSIIFPYHTSKSRDCMGVNGEPCSCVQLFFTTSHA